MSPLNLPPSRPLPSPSTPQPWKVLVVDDDDEVRTLTRLALESFHYRGRGLALLEAASADEAKILLNEHGDTAVAIVDVVMETDHAGLDLVRWIREDRRNSLVRLLIRTGQAGLFPASSVIASYEINDFWEKTEMTFARMQNALTTSLRSYEDLLAMHRRTVQLRLWADRFPDLLGVRDWNTLLRLVMLRLGELFPENALSAFLCRNDGQRWPVISGNGHYPATGSADVIALLDDSKAGVLLQAWDRQGFAESESAQALYFEVSTGEGHLFFLDLPDGWADYERNVTRLILQNFRAAIENRTLINDLERHRQDLSSLLDQQQDVSRELHLRFQSSLQVVLSFCDIEGSQPPALAVRSPATGVQRRLHVLALLHAQMASGRRTSGLDFQTFLRAQVEHDRAARTRPSDPELEYWGVPVEVSIQQAVPLALAAVEMIDLVLSPLWRGKGRGPVRLVLSDNPRSLTVSRDEAQFPTEVPPVPLPWQLIRTLADQLGGAVVNEDGVLRLSF